MPRKKEGHTLQGAKVSYQCAEETIPLPGSLLSWIVMGLTSLFSLYKNKEISKRNETNAGNTLADAYFWDEVYSYAKKRSDGIWAQLEKDRRVEKDALDPGNHELEQSTLFVLSAKVSQPVRRFNSDVMAKAMSKKFKVAIPTAVQMIEAAKVGTKSQVVLSVTER